MTLTAIFLLASFLLCCGVSCILIRRNAVQVLMGVELALNAASLNFVGLSQLGSPAAAGPHGFAAGQIFTLMIIILAASEAAVALAIILALFNRLRSVDVTAAHGMKE